MGRKQKQRRFLDDDYQPNNSYLAFGDDDAVVEERKAAVKSTIISKSFKSSFKPRDESRRPSHQHKESELPGPPAKKKFKLDPKPELVAFRKDLPIYSGTHPFSSFFMPL